MHFVEAKGILSAQNGMNLYRGCTHGCIYCDSRSACYGFTHAFEDIEVKINAPELLEQALKSKRKPCMIGTGAMTDPYLPLEKELCLTRRCLEIIYRYGFGATVQTKSTLIRRDLDLLSKINERAKAVVQMTLTTYDEALCRVIEPHVATTRERFETLLACSEAGIPTVVWLSPILPFINDTLENLEGILHYCHEAGVKGIICFGMGVTLREGDREYFFKNLDAHFPGVKQQYLKTYGFAYENQSKNEDTLMKRFHTFCREHGILHTPQDCFAYLKEFPLGQEQLSLF